MDFTLAEAIDLVAMFEGDGGDPDDPIVVTVSRGDDEWHSGPGLYAHFAEYPGEGSVLLGDCSLTKEATDGAD